MAKDGTARGGARPGSGPKKKPLFDKILAGDLDGVTVLPEPADLDGIEMPKIKDFMKAQQRDGSTLAAPEIFKETWNWLKARGCEKQVNTQLLEEFSMAAARWIQCEEAISQYGLLAKHPTTSAPTTSPYVSMSQNFQKQMNNAWYQIFAIVKDQCSVNYSGPNPQDNVMELLLTRKGQ